MQRFSLLFIAFLCVSFACAQPPAPDRPDMIIIQPKGKSSTPPAAAPATSQPIVIEASDRPGFLVIRPNSKLITPGIQTTANVEPAPNHFGSVTIIRPKTNGMASGLPNPLSSNPIHTAGLPKPPQQPTEPTTELPDPAKGKLIYETWDAVFVKSMQIGYVHTTIREFDKDGTKFLYAVKELSQTVSRFGQRVTMGEEETTFETPDGKVLVYRRKQTVGKNAVLSVTGTVSGKQIILKGDGAAAGMNETVPWPDNVIGIAKETDMMKGKNLKAGETMTYLMFAGQVNWVAKYTITMKGSESMALYQGEAAKEYHKVEVAMEPIRDKQGAVFALPASTVWHDPTTGWAVKAEFDMPPLGGLMTVTRTTKDAAMRAPGNVPELFDVQSIKLNQVVDNVHNTTSIIYKVTASKDADPMTMFARDGRQTSDKFDADKKQFEMTIRTGTAKIDGQKAPTEELLKECLGTSFYIDWDKAETKSHAQLAVRGMPLTATALDKAKAIESWVRNNMRSTEFSQAMSSCNTVAKTLSGDCTEYSMLACGMCRSLGIPARTNLGLVYAPDKAGSPYLAFHMWFEVYADNRWTALDGTLALGKIGPGHVKISDVTWHNETSMAPLLPVLRVLMAKPNVDVQSVVK